MSWILPCCFLGRMIYEIAMKEEQQGLTILTEMKTENQSHQEDSLLVGGR